MQFLVSQFKINHQGMVHLIYSNFMQRSMYHKKILLKAKIQFFRQKNEILLLLFEFATISKLKIRIVSKEIKNCKGEKGML